MPSSSEGQLPVRSGMREGGHLTWAVGGSAHTVLECAVSETKVTGLASMTLSTYINRKGLSLLQSSECYMHLGGPHRSLVILSPTCQCISQDRV